MTSWIEKLCIGSECMPSEWPVHGEEDTAAPSPSSSPTRRSRIPSVSFTSSPKDASPVPAPLPLTRSSHLVELHRSSVCGPRYPHLVELHRMEVYSLRTHAHCASTSPIVRRGSGVQGWAASARWWILTAARSWRSCRSKTPFGKRAPKAARALRARAPRCDEPAGPSVLLWHRTAPRGERLDDEPKP